MDTLEGYTASPSCKVEGYGFHGDDVESQGLGS